MTKLPALFIGHGSPMNTLELNGYTRAWRELGEALPRPRAILVISAHWYIGATAVTAMSRPRTIHDFFGFPQELFDFEYPAPGSPEVAGEIVEAVKPEWVGLDHEQWGLDHGTWSVLAHLFPRADVPVVQLSLNASKPLAYHFDLGARLAALRDKGVLIVSSGNVVHNLRLIEWDKPTAGTAWARRFDEAAREQMRRDPAGIADLTQHTDYARAVPTPDHFLPLLYTAGLAAAEGGGAQPILEGYAMGSLSMTGYNVGPPISLNTCPEDAAEIPANVPADQTNT
ncbi:dioxygenase [Tsuneonella deserti]|uniref:Dioxygenase n=1 Tax=Tsuneonella deserti TaxID=2035528 RepID=A0ABQ1S5U2_9SPHN|nr:4,5-DOPA dioxygenase extradiol [Tsuneonella deserti]GGD92179.1 dioxygenase [Tsuneonella deserti]